MNHSYNDKRKYKPYFRPKFKSFGMKMWVLTMLVLLGFQSIAVKSQQYPVKLVPVVLPPYSMRLGDYATSTDNKLQLQVLMTDLMEPQHQTGIKFTLEAGLSAVPFAKSNDFIVGMNTFMLYPGSNVTLTNVDLRALFELQNLGGISAVQYAQPLSDGVYQFCFQAYDFYTKNNLSSKTCATVFLTQYDPPMLNLPQNGEKIQAMSPYAGGSGIVFQWMPRQIAPNTKYIFTLKELWDAGQSPISGFLSSPPLWQEETYAPTLYYSLDKTQLIPGKRYAWQVQAKSGNPVLGANPTEDNGIYKNNGLSEIYYFDYVENCTVPTLLMAKNVGRGRVEISWSLGGKPAGLYNVQYRKKDSNTDWVTQQSYQSPAILNGLEDLTEYEYRVGSLCGNMNGNTSGNAYSYSAIQYFTTNANDVDNNYQCGIMPSVDIANKNSLQTMLGVNEVFTAGDFPVTVLSAEGNNGIYTGTGYIIVPYLADTRVKVIFNNIMLNTDKKLIEGVIETTYDPNESAIHYASAGIGETFGDAGVKDVFITFPIGNITYSATPPPGKITITGSDGGGGTGSTTEYPGGKDYTFTDSKGEIWTVDENGIVTKGGTVAKGGASTSTNTDGVTGSGKNATVNQYTAKGVKIEWKENVAGHFAYDTEEKNKLPKDKYPSVKDSENNTVSVPYKATVNKKTELFDAKVSITDPLLKDATIIFKTLSIGKEIEATEISKTDTERSYQLKLIGSFDYAEEEVIAVLMPKDSISKQKVISSFRLVHLSPKTVNVSLVPLDANSQSKLQSQGDQLNQIYNRIGVTFNIKKESALDIGGIVSGDTINSEDSDLMSTYSPQQQQINAMFKTTYDRYVLFVTNKKSSTGQKGYMRLNGQFGYVYNNAQDKTGAHELGHGVFKLEHPWKAYGTTQSATPLLMDYSTGEELSHLDWKQINDPAFKLYAFQGQSSGSYETDGHYSTVYLVSLMLGMNPAKAKELATATEAPDTTIHNDTKFELNDTWGHMDGSQQNLHSLTGGFHGIEEFFTAIKFLYAPKENIKLQGELLHRFGDTYAHSQIGNFKPVDMKENIDLKNADDNTIKNYINSWKQIGTETTLGSEIKPWIKFFNYYLEKDGLEFLNNETKQKEIFKGKTLKEALKDLYLTNTSSNFIMYGKNGFTLEHAFKDGGYPDMIYLRPDWYYIYVQNLSWIISTKYGLDNSKLDLSVFDRMINFLKNHANEKPSMKGIIDYEISKKLNEKIFYVPVFYASGDRLLALADATIMTNYLKVAKDIVSNTKIYLLEQGISANDIKVEEISEFQSNGPEDMPVNVILAYKITITK